jgi:hypothetical protein
MLELMKSMEEEMKTNQAKIAHRKADRKHMQQMLVKRETDREGNNGQGTMNASLREEIQSGGNEIHS